MKATSSPLFNPADFDRYYTPGIRVFTHITTWLLFIFFMYFGYLYNVEMPSALALFLSIRIAACTIFTFYIFSYLIFPPVIQAQKYGLLIVFIPCIFYIWLIINKLAYSLALYANMNLQPIYHYLGKNPSPSFEELFTFKYILLNVPSVIFAVSPFFFAKIVTQLTKNYARIIHSEKEKTVLKIERIEMEKQMLVAQLNPHFLFNTLNNIYGMILKNDERAGGTVISLSKIMKYTLYENNIEKVSLQKEISFMEEYFTLNRTRYPSATDLQLDKEIHQNPATLYIAPLLTFVFIENSFKYGLKNKKNKFLKMRIVVENNTFSFSIENDRNIPLYELKDLQSSGLGLRNVRQRLHLIYPDRHTLKISEHLQSFKVFLSINLI